MLGNALLILNLRILAAEDNELSDDIPRKFRVPPSCCSVRVLAAIIHASITDWSGGGTERSASIRVALTYCIREKRNKRRDPIHFSKTTNKHIKDDGTSRDGEDERSDNKSNGWSRKSENRKIRGKHKSRMN